MRMMVFFDLPTVTKAEKRAYTLFRRFLLNDGYERYPNFWTGKLKIISQLARSIHETHPPTDIYSGI